MVDHVLSDNSGHRRFLFEEASGITKYKARKKEALSKLEATETDLVRAQRHRLRDRARAALARRARWARRAATSGCATRSATSTCALTASQHQEPDRRARREAAEQ